MCVFLLSRGFGDVYRLQVLVLVLCVFLVSWLVAACCFSSSVPVVGALVSVLLVVIVSFIDAKVVILSLSFSCVCSLTVPPEWG